MFSQFRRFQDLKPPALLGLDRQIQAKIRRNRPNLACLATRSDDPAGTSGRIVFLETPLRALPTADNVSDTQQRIEKTTNGQHRMTR